MMTNIYSTYLLAAVLVAVPKYEDLPLPMPSTRIRLCAHCPSGKKDSWKTTKNADIISKLAIVLITSHIDNILISSVPQYYMFIDNPPFPILRPSICTRIYHRLLLNTSNILKCMVKATVFDGKNVNYPVYIIM